MPRNTIHSFRILTAALFAYFAIIVSGPIFGLHLHHTKMASVCIETGGDHCSSAHKNSGRESILEHLFDHLYDKVKESYSKSPSQILSIVGYHPGLPISANIVIYLSPKTQCVNSFKTIGSSGKRGPPSFSEI